MNKLVQIAAVAAIASSLAASAHAGVTLYNDLPAFLAATEVSGTDGFETAAFNTLKTYSAYQGAGFTISSTKSVYVQDAAFNAYSDWGTGDTGILPYNAPLTITFDSPVHAFGIDLMTHPVGRTIEVATGDYSGSVDTAAYPGRTFFGFTSSEGFTSLTLRSNLGYLIFDNLVYGDLAAPSGVPEPDAWALMIVGFGGVGAMVRRRRTVLAGA